MNRANRPRLSRISGSSYASKLLGRAGDGSTLTLDFTTGVLDPRLTFTRSTTGTYINSSGYVTSASINTARFDYDPATLTPRGLLIEGAATNRLFQSSAFSTSPWSPSNYTFAGLGYTSPDGVTLAQRWTVDTGAVFPGNVQACANVTSTSVTLSIWWRNGNHTNSTSNSLRRVAIRNSTTATILLDVSILNPATTPSILYNTGSSGASLTQYQDGWYRLVMTVSSGITSGNTIQAYVGGLFGSVTGAGEFCYWWGAQLEDGSGASSYIPTGASTGSRGQDLVSITSTDFSSWWLSSNPLSMWFDMAATGRALTNGVFRVADASGSAYGYQAYWFGTSFPIQLRATISGPVNSDISLGTVAANTRTKFAYTINSAAVKRFKDGSLVNTVSTPTLPPDPMSRFYFGGNPAFGGASGDFHLRGFKYWPIVLPDSQIISLTT